jgi:hypothetical protein
MVPMLFDDRGNVALLFALLAPLLMGAAGAGIDFQRWHTQVTKAQEAADELATRGAREYLLKNANDAEVKSLIEATAKAQYFGEIGEFELAVVTDYNQKSVHVQIFQAAKKSYFLKSFEPFKSGVDVDATAVARGVTNICVIGLDPEKENTVYAGYKAKLDAPKCSIMSNSTSKNGITATYNAKLSADIICSVGGYSGSLTNFNPEPITDCPSMEDPLSKRLAPSIGVCDEYDLELGDQLTSISDTMDALTRVASDSTSVDGTYTDYKRYYLQPGVYCGGIKIYSNADVYLSPGIYIIKDGALEVDLGSRLTGENVGFYLAGDLSTFRFGIESVIKLTAPKSGLMSGLLFFEDRNAPIGRVHSILSSNARTLIGTFYLPRGILEVASLKPVADQSAYTAIVARQLRLHGTPTLVLNANYNATDIPTPEGVGPTGGQVFLRE